MTGILTYTTIAIAIIIVAVLFITGIAIAAVVAACKIAKWQEEQLKRGGE